MPKMNGLEVLKQIKKMDPGAKIVMITALGRGKIVRECIFAGADSFIVKPFKEDIVVKALNQLYHKM